MHKPGDIVGQLASRQELVTNLGAMEAATRLYYLERFSASLRRLEFLRHLGIPRVMSDLQGALGEIGVGVEALDIGDPEMRRAVELEFAFRLKEVGEDRASVLIGHDCDALCHNRNKVNAMREGRLLLTWDKKLITVAAKIQGNGWVVSPDTAADFMQAYRPISEVRFRKLAQAIAQVSHQEDEVTARVIDGLVGIAAERNVDWKLDDEIARLKHRVLSGVDFTDPRYQEWVDSELFEYASERTGISVKELKNSTA